MKDPQTKLNFPPTKYDVHLTEYDVPLLLNKMHNTGQHIISCENPLFKTGSPHPDKDHPLQAISTPW